MNAKRTIRLKVKDIRKNRSKLVQFREKLSKQYIDLLNKIAPTRRKKALVLILIIFCISVIVLSIVNRPTDSQNTEEFNEKSDVVTYSSSTPDETLPDSNFNWVGGAEDPKRIKISALGIDGFIEKVGVDQNQQIAVPSNIHIAGWFADSVKPGSKGLSIIDGHRDGISTDGIFRNLDQLNENDIIEIEFGNGEIKKFQVRNVKTLTTEETLSPLFSQDPKTSSQLNLITCTGTFDARNQTYDKRVLVTSVLLD